MLLTLLGRDLPDVTDETMFTQIQLHVLTNLVAEYDLQVDGHGICGSLVAFLGVSETEETYSGRHGSHVT